MKNGKIYWVLQKTVGLVLLILSLIFQSLLVEMDAVIVLVILTSIGTWMLLTKERMFYRDYIFDIKKFLE